MRARFAITAALLLGLGVVALTVGDYGIGWDESAQATYGELSFEYFASGGADQRANEFLDLHLYGALFELAAASVYAFAPESEYLIRHALVALTGLLTVLAVFRIGSLLASPLLGAFAAIVLATLPRFYGHAFINSKDVPFACAVAWSMFALLRLVESRKSWGRAVLCGLAFGAALALRPGGAPLLVLLYLATLGFAAAGGGDGRTWLSRSLVVAAVAWTAMVIFWPWAHQNPLLNPLRAMSAALAFPTAYEVLFAGEVIPSDALPRSYFAAFLGMTTPPLVLVLALAGALLCARDVAKGLRHESRSLGAVAALGVLLWIALPLLSAAVLRPNVYDGLRHVLFVLPALALLAGHAAVSLVGALRDRAARQLGVALLGLLLLLPVWNLVKLHPYQMTYFNSFVGGLAGASGRYETDYWVTSYREAAEWLNARALEQPGRRLSVLGAVDHYSRECLEHYLLPEIELTNVSDAPTAQALPQRFDYYVATTRYGLDRRYASSPVVYEIGRDGAVFTVIRESRPPLRARPPRSGAPPGRAPRAR